MRISETTAKSMLVASKLPDADYVVNPYTGCSFACVYCYASFMGRFVNEPIESWGEYLSVKTNAVELFVAELSRLKPDKRTRSIFIASVTDAWQGVEKKYRLTRGILEALVEAGYAGMVGALTKSPLILRDADLFAALPRAEVGVTITTTDDAVGRFMEVHAPMAEDRLQTLRALNKAGLDTYSWIWNY